MLTSNWANECGMTQLACKTPAGFGCVFAPVTQGALRDSGLRCLTPSAYPLHELKDMVE